MDNNNVGGWGGEEERRKGKGTMMMMVVVMIAFTESFLFPGGCLNITFHFIFMTTLSGKYFCTQLQMNKLRLKKINLFTEAFGNGTIDNHPICTKLLLLQGSMGFPDGASGKDPVCPGRRCWFDPWVGMIPWSRKWQPTAAFLLGKSHGQRSLVGYSPWGCRVRYD